ncbi:MAG: BON domain-containing protein [Acidobacteriaceae bacterium]
MHFAHLRTAPGFVLALALALAVATGCNKNPATLSPSAAAPATDQQISVDVQSKILGDSAVSNKQLTINANDGVVSLSGEVSSDVERIAAANDAGSVAGVKTVINNLSVAAPVAPTPVAAAPAPKPRPERRSVRERTRPSPARTTTAQNTNPAPVKTYSDSSAPAGSTPLPAPAVAQNTPPPPPPAPAKVSVPSGTGLSVRLTQPLASNTNHQGDTFKAELQSPIVVDDQVVIPQGATLEGRVVSVQAAGKFAGAPQLALTLYNVSYNGHSYNIDTDQWSKIGGSRTKSSAEKIGGGAAVGAILGGIFGGGRGAAIGAAAGGGAGTAAQGLSKAGQVTLDSEAVLSFRLQNPVTVSPASTNNSPRQRLELPPPPQDQPQQ